MGLQTQCYTRPFDINCLVSIVHCQWIYNFTELNSANVYIRFSKKKLLLLAKRLHEQPWYYRPQYIHPHIGVHMLCVGTDYRFVELVCDTRIILWQMWRSDRQDSLVAAGWPFQHWEPRTSTSRWPWNSVQKRTMASFCSLANVMTWLEILWPCCSIKDSWNSGKLYFHVLLILSVFV